MPRTIRETERMVRYQRRFLVIEVLLLRIAGA
jgi:hypothetical protein